MAVALFWFFYFNPLRYGRIPRMVLFAGPYGIYRVIRGIRTRIE